MSGLEPPQIRQRSAAEVKGMIDSGVPFEFVDVRTEQEYAIARIDGARLLDQAYHDTLLAMDRDTPIVFHCHLGVRSQQAAEYFRQRGFRDLTNLSGGIDAWSVDVDPSVPRY
jgi:rhodanese-related sulfurtransferase